MENWILIPLFMHAFLREQKAVADRDRQLDLKYSLPRAREPLLARIVLLKDGGRNNFPIINQVFLSSLLLYV